MKFNTKVWVLTCLFIVLCFTSLGFANYPNLENDLMHYYKMEDLSFIDKMGLKNGTNSGTVSTTGKIGNGAYKDTNTDYVNIYPSTFTVKDKLSLSFWFKQPQSNYPSFDSGFVFGYGVVLQSVFEIQLRSDRKDKLSILFVKDSDNYVMKTCDNADNPTEWNHFVFTRDGNDVKIYKNGVSCEVDFIAATGTLGEYTVPSLHLIGSSGRTQNIQFYMDEFGIWNTSLSSSVINDSYHNYINSISGYGNVYTDSSISISSINITANYPDGTSSLDTIQFNAQNVTCSAVVNNSDNISYRWYKNNNIINHTLLNRTYVFKAAPDDFYNSSGWASTVANNHDGDYGTADSGNPTTRTAYWVFNISTNLNTSLSNITIIDEAGTANYNLPASCYNDKNLTIFMLNNVTGTSKMEYRCINETGYLIKNYAFSSITITDISANFTYDNYYDVNLTSNNYSGTFNIFDNISCQVTIYNESNSAESNRTLIVLGAQVSSTIVSPSFPEDNDDLQCSYTLAHSAVSNVTYKWYENKTEITSTTKNVPYSVLFDYTYENQTVPNGYALVNISIDNFDSYIGKNLTIEYAIGSNEVGSYNFIAEEKHRHFIFDSGYASSVPIWFSSLYYSNRTEETTVETTSSLSSGSIISDCLTSQESCVYLINDSLYTTSAYYSMGDLIPGYNFWIETTGTPYGSSIRDFRIYQNLVVNSTSGNLSSDFTSIHSNYSCEVSTGYDSLNSSEVEVKDTSILNVRYNEINSSTISYEHGSVMRVVANVTDSLGNLLTDVNLCINETLTGYEAINCSNTGILSFNLTTNTIENKFSNGQTLINLSFSENTRVNFTSYSGDDEANFKNWVTNGTTYSHSGFNVNSNNDVYITMKNPITSSNYTVYYYIDPTPFSCTASMNYSVSFKNLTSNQYINYYSNYTTNSGDWGVPLDGYFGFIFPTNLSSDFVNSSTHNLYVHFIVKAYDCESGMGGEGDTVIFKSTNVTKRYYDTISINLGKETDATSVLVNMTGYSTPSLPNDVKVYVDSTLIKTISGSLVSGSYNLTTFNTSLNYTNITFHSEPISDSATTKYVGIYLPKNVNVTNATLNIKGLVGKGYKTGATSVESSYTAYVSYIYHQSSAYDSDWLTNFEFNGGGVGGTECIDEANYTLNMNYSYSSDIKYTGDRGYYFKMSGFDTTCTRGEDTNDDDYYIYLWNYSGSQNDLKWHTGYAMGQLYNFNFDSDYLSDTNISVKVIMISPIGQKIKKFYEGGITYNSYPYNVYFKIGDNTIFSKTSEFNTTNLSKNFNTEINSYLATCIADSSGYCTVPLKFISDNGAIELTNLSVTYSNNYNPVNITSSALQTSDDNNNGNIVLGFESNTESTIEFSDLKAYYNGYRNFTSQVYYIGSDTYADKIDNKNISIYYSKWNYNFPTGISEIVFRPSTSTSKSVFPQGQTSTKPIINVSYLNYNKESIMSLYINNLYSLNLTTYIEDKYGESSCSQYNPTIKSSDCVSSNIGKYSGRTIYATSYEKWIDNNPYTYAHFSCIGLTCEIYLNSTYIIPIYAKNITLRIYYFAAPYTVTYIDRNIGNFVDFKNKNEINIDFLETNAQYQNNNHDLYIKIYNDSYSYNISNELSMNGRWVSDIIVYWTTDKININNNTWTNITYTKSYDDNSNFWMWIDLNFTKIARLVQPDYYFRACCVDCVCDEDVTNVAVS